VSLALTVSANSVTPRLSRSFGSAPSSRSAYSKVQRVIGAEVEEQPEGVETRSIPGARRDHQRSRGHGGGSRVQSKVEGGVDVSPSSHELLELLVVPDPAGSVQRRLERMIHLDTERYYLPAGSVRLNPSQHPPCSAFSQANCLSQLLATTPLTLTVPGATVPRRAGSVAGGGILQQQQVDAEADRPALSADGRYQRNPRAQV
jgi:hypothetical protein